MPEKETIERAHRDAEPCFTQIECRTQSVLGAVDDAAVIAEHEATNGGDADDGGDQRQVGGCIAINVQIDSPLGAVRRRPTFLCVPRAPNQA